MLKNCRERAKDYTPAIGNRQSRHDNRQSMVGTRKSEATFELGLNSYMNSNVTILSIHKN